MTLENTVLERLADWRPHAGRQPLLIPDAGTGWTVHLTADRCDDLGCLLWDMTLRRTTPAPHGADLRAWADRAAARATGLLEPLKVIEIDLSSQEALLRSHAPTVRGERRLYYEVLLKNSTEVLFRRFQGTPAGAGPRTQVPFALTLEALAKLTADLTADE